MKKRLDVLVFEKNLVISREKAKALILSGKVMINGEVKTKSGEMISCDAVITLKEEFPYVSRGGLKLEHALKEFSLNVSEKICIDIGSSTGGFTDVLLKNNAQKVYAVDVGTNQLSYSLRTDPRVVVMEKTNVKDISITNFPDKIDFAVIDVSFISLKSVLKPVFDVLTKKELVVLVKPQFEVGDTVKRFNGVVKDSAHRLLALERVRDYALNTGLFVQNACYSPIKGPKGNVEFFLYLTDVENNVYFNEIVDKANDILK